MNPLDPSDNKAAQAASGNALATDEAAVVAARRSVSANSHAFRTGSDSSPAPAGRPYMPPFERASGPGSIPARKHLTRISLLMAPED